MTLDLSAIDLEFLNPEKAKALLENLQELKRRQKENALNYYTPYDKQQLFHNASATARERLFLAGNQLGKTYSGAAELAYHLTGNYPSWWKGRRFLNPIRAWAMGETAESTRDTCQRLLLGPPNDPGGFIPASSIKTKTLQRGVSDCIDTITIRHKSGGTSQLTFKSYNRQREKLQGETIHVVWCDEEPTQDIYGEILARITATKGIAYITATPLKGVSEVISKFLNESNPDRFALTMTISDALHIAPEERQRIIDGYADHEREARANGVPMLGSGRIYDIAESVIKCDPIPLPHYWPKIAAVDFGIRNFAITWMAHDRETDTLYVYDCLKLRDQTPDQHALAIRARGTDIPVAYPHDGEAREKSTGKSLGELYRNLDVAMMDKPVTFDDGSNSVERGIAELKMRMKNGQFKVFSHLNEWFDEFRLYHRVKGIIHKENDHILDSTRYCLMALPEAREVGMNGKRNRRPIQARSAITEYNLFSDDFNSSYQQPGTAYTKW